jgi:hypothetical protein
MPLLLTLWLENEQKMASCSYFPKLPFEPAAHRFLPAPHEIEFGDDDFT